ncbi:glycine, alanine and asparagine-rich protein [Eurytemora carolleeae]|uniref:glycine, alanine and asparagine-rich protein n=1 Tax=Eurytemora carolleeae TaxID=1294199 RepID=UPI000C75929A|nr:glycine, alanine and asparagine-rich protein [Eurytemora carolleeae]|eukprot:XP_023340737.1 glycine, alanine and asparagine-rich protein-like [Eurytemora affinis]
MFKSVLVLLASPLCLGAPQEGFGDASAQEIAEIRAGTYLETFDENPQYSFNYKVADDTEQTYMAMNEDRAGDQVTGSYQYVDPLGSLIIVSYTAGPMGYTETREVKEGFVQIQQRPAKQSSSTSSSFNGASSGSFNGASSGSFNGASSGSSFSGASSGSSFNGANSGSSFNGASSGSINGAGSGSSFNGAGSGSSFNGASSGSFFNGANSGSSFNGANSDSSFNGAGSGSSFNGANSGSSFNSASSSNKGSSTFSSGSALSSNTGSSSQSSSFSDDIISSVVSQVQPLISQTVFSTISGSSLPAVTTARPLSVLPAAPAVTEGAISEDIISQVVAQLSPLVSQTVSSAVSGSNLNSGSRFQASRPAPVPAPRAPRPVQASASASRNVGSVAELFGSGGDFNVRFNTPSFNIEY